MKMRRTMSFLIRGGGGLDVCSESCRVRFQSFVKVFTYQTLDISEVRSELSHITPHQNHHTSVSTSADASSDATFDFVVSQLTN